MLVFKSILIFLFFGIVGCISFWSSPKISDFEVTRGDTQLGRIMTGIVTYDSGPFSGSIMEYHSNGQIKSKKQYWEGKRQGESSGYYEDGTVAHLRAYKKGEKHGTHIGWYPDGKMKFKYIFDDGLSTGTHFEWYADGHPFKQMNYEDGLELGSQKVWSMGRKMRANYVVRENGRKYGLVGLKRCTNINTKAETFDRITENTNGFSQ